MQGYRVVERWLGLDCRLSLKLALGFTGKAQIEEYGIASSTKSVGECVDVQRLEEFTKRLVLGES